ncbi:thiamine-phosphate kinase [Nocardia neocaledoniensis]|uniref:thiamine-phosphate kinase n=1 Tax=Nocardia neocaledoniensis TaxID=236511 RepID=UPI002456C201|nr:thiamine-phosphate kinase [Nocardia neocaledoniensis]
MSEDSRPRTVRELGEFAVIDLINAGREQAAHVLLGPGDDAAVIAAPDGRFVVSTDMLVEGRHFRLDWSSPVEIGRKAIAQNAADIVAMGARPTAFVVALGCPADTAVPVITGLADGLWTEASRAGGSIAGGDLVHSEQLVISVTAFGDLGGQAAVTRSGARAGDVVAVAGELGWSAAGLAVLSSGADLSAPAFAHALATHRVPQPPYAAVLDLTGEVRPTALTDVSDGLLADLGHLAAASGVAVDVHSAALADPELAAVARGLNADAAQWILAGGEDHAFAGTWPAGLSLPPGWRPIGVVGAGSGVTVDGAEPTGGTGWESFRGADVTPTGRKR